MGRLDGKVGVVYGVANKRSIATWIAQACYTEGARMAFAVQSERVLKEAAGELGQMNPIGVHLCDVAKDDGDDGVGNFANLVRRDFQWSDLPLDKIDFIVHSVAFARGEDLERGGVLGLSREGYHLAHDISAYSLIAVVRSFLERGMLADGASILTMTYLGSHRVFREYGPMGPAKASLESIVPYLANDLGPTNGIRVNAISAGPLKTLASRAIKNFSKMHQSFPRVSPLRRNVEPQEVANAAVFLLSPESSGITGTTLFVDCGFHAMGMVVE